MKAAPMDKAQAIQCYISTAYPCGYLEGRQARNLIIDPALPLTDVLLGNLLAQGFRRSGRATYRPHCDGCQACIPVRLPCQEYQPDRSQRRNFQKNKDLEHISTPAEFNAEQFKLYCRYLHRRHPGSDMDNPTEEQYLSFLTCPELSTRFNEFRLNGRLAAVAVVDYVPDGLSAVYSFYDPDLQQRGLGTYMVQWQIEEAKRLGLPWLYLGYWIEACQKMSYKKRFHPLEFFQSQRWQRLPQP